MPPPNQNLTPFRTRIGGAIFKLSEKSPTYMRRFLDEYMSNSALNPSLADAGDSVFPLSLRRHPVNPDRTAYNTKDYVLYFHCGNAIATFFDAVLGIPAPRIEHRVRLLEEIAKRGYEQFYLDGDDAVGYTLRNDGVDQLLAEIKDG